MSTYHLHPKNGIFLIKKSSFTRQESNNTKLILSKEILLCLRFTKVKNTERESKKRRKKFFQL